MTSAPEGTPRSGLRALCNTATLTADRQNYRIPDILVLPGHGLDTTIGTERPHLDEWVERGW